MLGCPIISFIEADAITSLSFILSFGKKKWKWNDLTNLLYLSPASSATDPIATVFVTSLNVFFVSQVGHVIQLVRFPLIGWRHFVLTKNKSEVFQAKTQNKMTLLPIRPLVVRYKNKMDLFCQLEFNLLGWDAKYVEDR